MATEVLFCQIQFVTLFIIYQLTMKMFQRQALWGDICIIDLIPWVKRNSSYL